MANHPRVAIIAYGSIVNPIDLKNLFHHVEDRVLPIKVMGFKRIFNQEASWRDVDGDERAVLNVVRNQDSWFNGLLVTDLRRDEFNEFRDRERGYRLIEVEHKQIEPYESNKVNTGDLGTSESIIKQQELTLVPVGKKTDDSINPIESYVQDCLNGARQWGNDFLSDFKSTTELNSGNNLRTHLED